MKRRGFLGVVGAAYFCRYAASPMRSAILLWSISSIRDVNSFRRAATA